MLQVARSAADERNQLDAVNVEQQQRMLTAIQEKDKRIFSLQHQFEQLQVSYSRYCI